MQMCSQIQIISIEGNIGSGKTTLLSCMKTKFKNNSQYIFLDEPVNEWNMIKDENEVTIIEKFYNDQKKYSFSFQILAFITRLKLIKEAINKIIKNNHNKDDQDKKYFIITERSLFTDKMVFAKMLYDSNNIEYINYQIYLKWFNTFADEYKINKIIYVKTNPKICHKRVEKRNRAGEDNIPLNYLTNCNLYHNNMLDKSSPECVCHSQLIIDGNVDIYKNTLVLDGWLLSIENFMLNL